MEEIIDIFPQLDRIIIEEVFYANNQNVEKTIAILVEMAQGCGTSNRSSVPEDEARRIQTEEDHRYALELQNKETARGELRQVRDTLNEVGIGPEAPDPFAIIGDGIKKGFEKSVENIKSFYGRVSNTIASSMDTTPRTEYTSLPTNHEFSKFVDDDDDERLVNHGYPSRSITVEEQLKRDEELARKLQDASFA
ncbi:hypothetical protein BC833DRAFT_647436 [Globomyces pollinis-pini]|nr:hypothetical protein BC833DRAFT_647436 [Globomyces pollinis-pini]